MISIRDLLKEEKAFTATRKETGNVSVFKTKAARDAAVKAGTHEVPEDEKGGKDEPKGEKPNMFSKDAGYDAPDAKKKQSSTDSSSNDNIEDIVSDEDKLRDFIESNKTNLSDNLSDKDYQAIKEIPDMIEYWKEDIKELEINWAHDPKTRDEFIGDRIMFIKNLKKKAQTLIEKGQGKDSSEEEPKKTEPKSQSSNSFSKDELDNALGDSVELDDFLDDNEDKFSKEDFQTLKSLKSSIQQLEGDLVDAEMEDDEDRMVELEDEIENEKFEVGNILDKYKSTQETTSTKLMDLLKVN